MPIIKEDILSTLAYFDIFHYPLTKKEIHLFLPNTHTDTKFQLALKEMVNDKMIYRFSEYYSLINEPSLIKRRSEGYVKAIKLLRVAHKIGVVLSKFPYVKGVAISGSLSKYYADEHSDIDFFIVTTGNRLWIARSFTHLLKKVSFLFKKQHFFCMNYYIDEKKLEIPEKNIFTATEIVTLLPITGAAMFESFFKSNGWTKKFLPNHFMRLSSAMETKGNVVKKLIEIVFNNPLGNLLDDALMNITAKRWLKKKQQNKLNDHGIVMSMVTDKHYSKPDPTGFQTRLIQKYESRLCTDNIKFSEATTISS